MSPKRRWLVAALCVFGLVSLGGCWSTPPAPAKSAHLREIALAPLGSQHTASITGLAFNPDGTRLVSTSRDGTIKVWKTIDLFRGDVVAALERTINVEAPIESLSVSSDGARALVACGEWASLVDVNSGEELASFASPDRWPVSSVALSPDGRVALVGETLEVPGINSSRGHGAIRFWDVASGELRKSFPTAQTLEGRRVPAMVRRVGFSPDGRWAFWTTAIPVYPAERSETELWDVARDRLIANPFPERQAPFFVPFSETCSAIGQDRYLEVRDVRNLSLVDDSREAPAREYTVAGTHIVGMGDPSSQTLILRSLPNLEVSERLLLPESVGNYRLAISPSERWLAVGSTRPDGMVRVVWLEPD
jgi:WD40 repeat protein